MICLLNQGAFAEALDSFSQSRNVVLYNENVKFVFAAMLIARSMAFIAIPIRPQFKAN